MKYDVEWIRAQDDVTLVYEMTRLADIDSEVAESPYERLAGIEQIGREWLGRHAQRRLAEEHGWPLRKPRLVK